jgi:hypothetical protein
MSIILFLKIDKPKGGVEAQLSYIGKEALNK